MGSPRRELPKMMLGFVVRRCAAAVGHAPTAQEFADWANRYRQGGREVHLFGRPISAGEAQLILQRPGRPVTASGATGHECLPATNDAPASNVKSFALAVERRKFAARKS